MRGEGLALQLTVERVARDQRLERQQVQRARRAVLLQGEQIVLVIHDVRVRGAAAHALRARVVRDGLRYIGNSLRPRFFVREPRSLRTNRQRLSRLATSCPSWFCNISVAAFPNAGPLPPIPARASPPVPHRRADGAPRRRSSSTGTSPHAHGPRTSQPSLRTAVRNRQGAHRCRGLSPRHAMFG